MVVFNSTQNSMDFYLFPTLFAWDEIITLYIRWRLFCWLRRCNKLLLRQSFVKDDKERGCEGLLLCGLYCTYNTMPTRHFATTQTKAVNNGLLDGRVYGTTVMG